MGSQKTKTTQQQTATTTPNVPGYVTPAVQSYFGNVSNLANNPTAGITPANDLQNGAFASAGNLPSGQQTFAPAIQGLNQAMDMLGNVQPAQVSAAVMPGSYEPITFGASQAALPAGYSPAQATTSQAALPAGYSPAQATATMAQAPAPYQAQQAQTAAYPAIGQAGLAQLPEYQTADTEFLSGLSAQGTGGSKASEFYQDYYNPYEQGVINTTIADMLNSQMADRAAYARRGVLRGAFGGSRFGLGEGQLIGEQGRARDSLVANMRSQGWRDAMTFGAGDADRSTNAGIASMQSANQFNSDKAQMQMQAALAEAQGQNQFGLAGFEAANNLSQFNTGQLNNALASIFDATNSNNQFNAGQANDAAANVYSTTAGLNQFNTGQTNQNSQFNTGAQNDMLSQLFGSTLQNNQFNTGQANQNSQFNTGQANDAAAQQYSTQADLAQTNAGLAQGANAANAGAYNDMFSQLFCGQLQTNQFNAGQANDASQFNSNLALNAANSYGDLAGQVGGLAGNAASLNLQNLNTQANLGGQQWDLENQNSPYSYLPQLANLLGGDGLLNLLTGQTVNSTGTGVSKTSGGLGSSLLGGLFGLGSAYIGR